MSLDNMSECPSCHRHGAVVLWAQFFQSPSHADASAGPEFLSLLAPKAACLKVEMCVLCGSMKAVTYDKYTEEEIDALKARASRSKAQAGLGEQIAKLFGKDQK